MCTVYQSSFTSGADEVTEPDTPCTHTEGASGNGSGIDGLETKLSACNVGISGVPHLVADCSPGLIHTDLNAAFTIGGSSHKANVTSLTEDYRYKRAQVINNFAQTVMSKYRGSILLHRGSILLHRVTVRVSMWSSC